MKDPSRFCWRRTLVAIFAMVGSTFVASRAKADDSALLRKKFDDVAAAVKAKDADKLWELLSAKSQKDAETIANGVRETYAKANAEEKRKLEEFTGLTAKEISQLSAKGYLKGQSVWRKYHDLLEQ